MATSLDGRRRWQMILLVLVGLPFLPDVAIRLVAMLASAGGCAATDLQPCTVGPFAVGALLRTAIQAAVGVGVVLGFGGILVWLWLAFIAVHRGFATLARRLVVAFLVTVILAYLPYLAPSVAIADLLHADCLPNDAGVGACRIYGTAMGRATNETQVVQWFAFTGGPLALVMFAVYAFIAATRDTSEPPEPIAQP